MTVCFQKDVVVPADNIFQVYTFALADLGTGASGLTTVINGGYDASDGSILEVNACGPLFDTPGTPPVGWYVSIRNSDSVDRIANLIIICE